MRKFLPFILLSSRSQRTARDRESTRRLQVERLEDRALLSAAPTILAQASGVATSSLVASDFSNAETDDEAIDLNLSTPSTSTERFDIVYDVLTSGSVRVLGQTGLQQVSSMSYCDVPNSIYIDLWERAISRWEEVISVGIPDTSYPYAVSDVTNLEIDDLYLYFGFSDSYSSSTSLGSSLNAGYYRDGGKGLPATGSLVFNAKYFTATPSESVQKVFYNTALHEMGHSLGYNVTHMREIGIIESTSQTPFGLDDVITNDSSYWYYVGEKGLENYLETFPEDFVSITGSTDRYVMETYTASGSFGAHPSSALGTYYLYLNQRDGMTYSISPLFEATLTPMTLGVLEDIGYTVDYNFADVCGSPAPENVNVEVVGSTAVLNWEKSAGDLSNAASGPATYSIERIDGRALARGEDAEWVSIATNVDDTTYIDATLEPGREYAYRVRATQIRTNKEVGVFKAKAGDVIEWDYEASRFSIYALVNNGSDALSWTRVVASTAERSWTVTALDKTPQTGTTLFRVIAVGIIENETEPSKVIEASVWSNANQYVPSGYSKTDWNALKAFLELQNESGTKNGALIAGDSYSPDLLDTLDGLTWSKIDGEYRLTEISWSGYGLVGDLNLLGCSALERVNVSNNSLSGFEADSFLITVLNVDDSGLSELDVSDLVALESLSCARNNLSILDLSNNLNLIYLNCSENEIAELNVSDAWGLAELNVAQNPLVNLDLTNASQLTTATLWSERLANVYLPSGFVGVVSFADSNANSYQWTIGSQIVGTDASLQFDGSDSTRVATLGFEDVTQTIHCFVGKSAEKPTSPTNLLFGDYEAGRVEMTWTDAAVGELGYKVYYSTDGSNWKLAETIPSNAEVSQTTGSTVRRVAKKVAQNVEYSFRVVAYGIDSTGAQSDSEPLEGTYAARSSLESPQNFVAYDYDSNAETLKLEWDAVNEAARYEVQYRRSDDGGTTWKNEWTRSEILERTSRQAIYVHKESFYGFRVRAISRTGAYSEWTEITFENASTLNAPENARVYDFNIANQTLVFSWDTVANATRYETQYRSALDSESLLTTPWSSTGEVENTSRTAQNVYAPYSYQFRVRALNNEGERSEWVVVNFTTDDSNALLEEVFATDFFDDFEA